MAAITDDAPAGYEAEEGVFSGVRGRADGYELQPTTGASSSDGRADGSRLLG